MAYKRILTIQDISCIGQCSMTVALPILSACGHETCILPTAVLSTHTGGFGKPAVHYLAQDLDAMVQHWRSQKITFDAILVGYLGSIPAIECAAGIIQTMRAPDGIIIVDPAMADHGKLYSGFDNNYAKAMSNLCSMADIVLPNITEAAMLTGIEYRDALDEAYIQSLMNGLKTKTVVMTGVGFGSGQTGAAICTDSLISYYHHDRVGRNYHGTGDIFASCFTGVLMQGYSIFDSVRVAADFTCKCIQNTFAEPAHWYGVKFETALPWLMKTLFDQ